MKTNGKQMKQICTVISWVKKKRKNSVLQAFDRVCVVSKLPFIIRMSQDR